MVGYTYDQFYDDARPRTAQPKFIAIMYSEAARVSLLVSSTYALYLSANSGILFNRYTSLSEKAAKVSDTAAHDQQMTEKTVGLAILSSLFSVVSVIYVSVKGGGWIGYIALFNVILQCASYKVLQNYWTSAKPNSALGSLVPGASDYARGWTQMTRVQKLQIIAGGLWTAITMMAAPGSTLIK